MAMLSAPATQHWAQPGKLQCWEQLILPRPRWGLYLYIDMQIWMCVERLNCTRGIVDVKSISIQILCKELSFPMVLLAILHASGWCRQPLWHLWHQDFSDCWQKAMALQDMMSQRNTNVVKQKSGFGCLLHWRGCWLQPKSETLGVWMPLNTPKGAVFKRSPAYSDTVTQQKCHSIIKWQWWSVHCWTVGHKAVTYVSKVDFYIMLIWMEASGCLKGNCHQ